MAPIHSRKPVFLKSAYRVLRKTLLLTEFIVQIFSLLDLQVTMLQSLNFTFSPYSFDSFYSIDFFD